jgi:ribosomal protein L7/L12
VDNQGSETVHEKGAPALTPRALKDAGKALDAALSTYGSRVEKARREFQRLERDHMRAVERAEKERHQAAQPRQIASIGTLRPVTLTETTIRTPKGTFALTPDVQATAQQHGNKQVVQGWVFKSDNDRREVYLHLSGPDWADVIPFSMKYSTVQPRQLHEFAAKVGVAARQSEQARQVLRDRVAAHDARLVAVRRDRRGVVEAVERWVAATDDVGEVDAACTSLARLADMTDSDDRKTRDARRREQLAHERKATLCSDARSAQARINGLSGSQAAHPRTPVWAASGSATARVVLHEAGPQKIKLVRALHQVLGVGVRQARTFVDDVPTTVFEGEAALATELQAALSEQGATVSVEPVEPAELVDDDVRETAPAPAPVLAPWVARSVPEAAGGGVKRVDDDAARAASPEVPSAAPRSRDGELDASSPPGPTDVFDQIRRLGELRDAGLITPDEFEAKKVELLARL